MKRLPVTTQAEETVRPVAPSLPIVRVELYRAVKIPKRPFELLPVIKIDAPVV
jgi:hypothetical protein